MKIIKKIAQATISPFAIGLFTTFFFVYLTFNFYPIDQDRTGHGFIDFMRFAHHKATDFRLLIRGPRKGSDQVAILAVDEPSVEEIGRWPWPREKIAKIVDTAVSYGARVIAFDVIFAEEDKNTTFEALSRLKLEAVQKSPPLVTMIDSELKNANSDLVLADTVARHTNHLVMGSYFEPLNQYVPAHAEKCLGYFFETSRAGEKWMSQEIQVIPLDQAAIETPDTFYDGLDRVNSDIHYRVSHNWLTSNPKEFNAWLNTNLGAISHQEKIGLTYWLIKNENEKIHDYIRSKRGSEIPRPQLHLLSDGLRTVIGDSQFVEFKRAIQDKQNAYCTHWLKPDSDPSISFIEQRWGDVQAFDTFYEGLDMKSGLKKFRQAHLDNAIQHTGAWWLDIPSIATGTKHTGYFNAFPDPDGTIRRTKLVVRTGNIYMASLALKAYALANNYGMILSIDEDPSLPGTKGSVELTFTNQEGNPVKSVPLNRRGEIPINYAGRRYMYPHVQLSDLLKSSPYVTVQRKVFDDKASQYIDETVQLRKDEFLRNKIFILGATAPGIYDLRVTPFEENYPGVETHANIVDSLIRDDFLIHHPDEKIYMPLALLALGLALSFCISQFGATASALTTLATLTVLYVVDQYVFFAQGLIVAVVFPIFLVFCIYLSLTFYRYVTEERKKRELKGTFAKYVSPAIVNEILADPENIELGGRKEQLSVFFSDIRGFTTISEKLDPADLSDLLNKYLTPMTEIVFRNKGTLDKYMGDAVMAFFGAPIPYPNHAAYACRCALQSLEKCFALQKEFKEMNYPPIDIGIGINTGDMSVGNMGSNIVRSYTVMGDAVNLGSRLEGINKQYGTRIIISEFTQKAIGDDFTVRELDRVKVKGKEVPVRIFELLSEGKPKDQETIELLQHFSEGFQFYLDQRFETALNHFKKCLEVRFQDGPARLYIHRCEEYIKSPPEANWDGVFAMKTK